MSNRSCRITNRKAAPTGNRACTAWRPCPGGIGLPALCRLARYEKSVLLSKQAAIELLGEVKPGADPEKDVVAAVRKVLEKSHRAAAEWLLTYARFGEDPAVAAAPWSKLVNAEESLLQTSPEGTTRDIVVALTRFQVARLKKLGRNDDELAALRRLLRLETGDAETLVEPAAVVDRGEGVEERR